LAVELDPVLAQHVAWKYPDVEVVLGDAVALGDLLAERDISQVDAVVSGLPWSLIRPDSQHAILDVVARALCPGAPFTTVAYLHARLMSGARGFRALLDEVFDEVLMTSTVWRNLPPALTYVCRRPRPRHGRGR
ncbi:MAG: SAM-dependent methyltransferase, partial [Actinomycetota bacterium]|nr:SAM-dependent methyltransferase [Actinomycetota bacterium]